MSGIHPEAATPGQKVKAWVRDRVWRNSSREHLDRFLAEAGRELPDGALVLDAGAGTAPYRAHFGRQRYETADFAQVDKGYGSLDYVCDLTEIPVEDARFDAVVFTQVLEHVPEPAAVLAELGRVLKPGGTLFLTAPLFYAEHEVPYDFYRYTRFGLAHLLEEAGFRIESLDWLEGYAGTLSYQLKEATLKLPVRPAAFGGGALGTLTALAGILLRIPMFVFSVMLGAADRRHRHTASGQSKNYRVVAIRRDGGDAA